jgi:hypothetical protein
MEDGLAGWTSTVGKGGSTWPLHSLSLPLVSRRSLTLVGGAVCPAVPAGQVLRELEGPPREQPGDSCQVVSEMAIVLDGLDAEAVEVGYLMSGDVVIVDESRVDE